MAISKKLALGIAAGAVVLSAGIFGIAHYRGSRHEQSDKAVALDQTPAQPPPMPTTQINRGGEPEAPPKTSESSSLPDIALIGARTAPVPDNIAITLDQNDPHGALVKTVMSGLPAAEAGLKPDDIIITVDNEPINAVRDFPPLIASKKVGVVLDVVVVRDHQKMHLSITPVSRRNLAESGDIIGMTSLAEAYAHGLGVPADYDEALRWYGKAADLGNTEAMNTLANLYASGRGVPRNMVEAIGWYRMAAGLDDLSAMNSLAGLYDRGPGVVTDPAEAIRWYRKAAGLGDRDAMKRLASIYQDGAGVAKNQAEATRWYRQAADLGETSSMYTLGYLYMNGTGGITDYAEAARWYRKAADLDNDDAMDGLAALSEYGLGIPRSDAEALKWYRKAADRGNLYALDKIASAYASGRGAPKDETEAARWYRKAADRGDGEAQKWLDTHSH